MMLDFEPAKCPFGTHMSHWWRQEGRQAKIAPVHPQSPTFLVDQSEPSYEVVNDVKDITAVGTVTSGYGNGNLVMLVIVFVN